MQTSQEIAKLLLQHDCIVIRYQQPFRWSSGLYAPIYCDNRRLLSFPKTRSQIVSLFIEQIKAKFGKPNAIAGVATGAIGIAALIADRINAPLLYVRPSPKSHGQKNQLEGVLPNKSEVLVIEDLVSTAKSSISSIQVLRSHGAKVLGMLSIFNYGFPSTEKKIKEITQNYETLCDYETLLKVALESKRVSKEEYEQLQNWNKDPQAWSQTHTHTS